MVVRATLEFVRQLAVPAGTAMAGLVGLLSESSAAAQTYSGTFSALQYNVAGLPFPNPDQNPAANTPYIARLLNNYDIVNIQKDFSYHHDTIYAASTHQFKSDRGGGKPDSFFGNDGINTLSKFEAIPNDPAKPNGLMRVTYNDCGNNFIECLSGKGFSIARLKLAGGGELDVYNTHTVAGDSAAILAARAANIHQLSDFMSEYSKDRAVLVMADSNSRYTRGTDDLRYLLDRNGLRDPWVDLTLGGIAPAAGASAMVCQPGSNPAPDPKTCEVVDKILYRGSATLKLDALSYQLNDPSFFNPDDGKSLSDHYPLIARFGFTSLAGAVPEPATWAMMIARTTDFLTEEKRPPLYGEDNLSDPWSNPQIQLIQRGFSPYLVADLTYWDQSGRSDDTGAFPVRTTVQPIGYGQKVTRDVTVFNDGLEGTTIDFAWAVRADSPTGKVLASGQSKLAVPLADSVTVPVTFMSPTTGAAVYLTLSSSVGGVLRFTDSSQYLPLGSASSIDDAAIGTDDRRIAYSGAWNHGTEQAGAYASTLSTSASSGAGAMVRFTGNIASLHAAIGPDRGIVAVSVDRGPETMVDLHAAAPASDQAIWSSPVLASGTHTLSMRLTGNKNPAATGSSASLDRIEAAVALTTTVVHAGSGRCLNLPGPSAADGAPVDLTACGGGRPQTWTLDIDGQVVNRESGKCLDIANASIQAGAPVQQWTCNRGGNQKWIYDARQRLTNPASGLCLDVDEQSGTSARRMVIRKCDDSPAGRWTLSPPAKATVATAPRDVTTVVGDGSITVSWKAPLSDGGAEITKYTVSSTPKSKGCVTSTGWSTYTCTVPGLTRGTPYTFTVTAQNQLGVGPAAAMSAPVIPR